MLGELVVTVAEPKPMGDRLLGERVERTLGLGQRRSGLVDREQLFDRAHVEALQGAKELSRGKDRELVGERQEVLVAGHEHGTLSLRQR